jgi:thiol-disulfide isomerase/thioredoxin
MFNAFLISLFSFTFSISPDKVQAVETSDTVKPAILYVFAGSDWCVNCRRLEKNVLSDSAFLSFLDSGNIKIEILDFPQRQKLSPEQVIYNQAMSEKLGFSGDFPTIVIYSTGNDKFKTLYYRNEDPSEFSGMLLKELSKLNE